MGLGEFFLGVPNSRQGRAGLRVDVGVEDVCKVNVEVTAVGKRCACNVLGAMALLESFNFLAVAIGGVILPTLEVKVDSLVAILFGDRGQSLSSVCGSELRKDSGLAICRVIGNDLCDINSTLNLVCAVEQSFGVNVGEREIVVYKGIGLRVCCRAAAVVNDAVVALAVEVDISLIKVDGDEHLTDGVVARRIAVGTEADNGLGRSTELVVIIDYLVIHVLSLEVGRGKRVFISAVTG